MPRQIHISVYKNSVKMKKYSSNSCEVPSWVLRQWFTVRKKTTISLPKQWVILAFHSNLHLSFQSQQFMATLTKSSLKSTCMVFEVHYAMKLCISEFLSSDPFLLCHVVMISLGRLPTLWTPCIICHLPLNANMHTPTADINPLYISHYISYIVYLGNCD